MKNIIHWPLFAVLFLLLPHFTYAGSFIDSSFEDAQNSADAAAKANNTKATEAKGELETGDTVKTIADYVGLAATTATIGTEVYDWTSEDEVKKLNDQYEAALAQRNQAAAQDILAKIEKIKKKKMAAAKDQANTQATLAKVQTVAGYSNLGASAASLFAAYKGFSAGGTLDSGMANVPTEEGRTVSKKAISAANSAGTTALIYGAGEAALGVGSLYLARRHQEHADDLKSLTKDSESDLSKSDKNVELALFDAVALSKCGANMQYQLLSSNDVANATATTTPTDSADPTGLNIRSTTVATTSAAQQDKYATVYNRIRCLGVPATTDTGTGSTASNGSTAPTPTTTCTMDSMICPDGSFVQRDPALSCQFRACPTTVSCASDTQQCSDGSFVIRDPGNNCQFMACPITDVPRSIASQTSGTAQP